MTRKAIIMLAIAMAATGGTADLGAASAPPPPSRQDREFLVQAHQGSLFEIEAGLAVTGKTDDQNDREAGKAVRVLGAKLVADHTKLDRTIRQVADQLGVKLPGEPSEVQRRRLKEVMALSGMEFDRAWIGMEIANHREGVALVKREIDNGSAPMVKKLAVLTDRVVREHLEMLLQIEKAIVPSPSKS
ncbi:DUF4142 domain-containing protein [Streptosporangium sp. NPDC006930]|uniref:DUF4142 domain-containing protein n=1 Tax=unclassified Streptosporangium TaxID=2632669 RepID=UPI00342E4F1E